MKTSEKKMNKARDIAKNLFPDSNDHDVEAFLILLLYRFKNVSLRKVLSKAEADYLVRVVSKALEVNELLDEILFYPQNNISMGILAEYLCTKNFQRSICGLPWWKKAFTSPMLL